MNKLLIIDEDKNITRPMKSFFKKRNYHVDVAHTGKEGISCISENRPDIVFLNSCLPDMSGVDVLEKIKETHKQIKTIMRITDHYLYIRDTKKRALSLGVDEYVEGIMSLRSLDEKINEMKRGLSKGE